MVLALAGDMECRKATGGDIDVHLSQHRASMLVAPTRRDDLAVAAHPEGNGVAFLKREERAGMADNGLSAATEFGMR